MQIGIGIQNFKAGKIGDNYRLGVRMARKCDGRDALSAFASRISRNNSGNNNSRQCRTRDCRRKIVPYLGDILRYLLILLH